MRIGSSVNDLCSIRHKRQLVVSSTNLAFIQAVVRFKKKLRSLIDFIDLFMKLRLECPGRISSILRKGMLPPIILAFVSICLPLKSYSAEVTLAWDPNIEADVDGYVLYYGIYSGFYTEAVDIGKLTEYTLTDLKVDTVYYFSVTAYDIYGNESDFSDELSHVISGNPPTPDNNRDDTDDVELLAEGSSDTGGCFIYSVIQ